MGYTSKYKGAEIDALLDKVEALPEGGNGGGVPIVSSEEERDALNLPVGSLVSVVKEESVTSIRYLYQPIESDFSEAGLNLSKCSIVNQLMFSTPPKDVISRDDIYFTLITSGYYSEVGGKVVTIDLSYNEIILSDKGDRTTWPLFVLDNDSQISGINQEAVSKINENLAKDTFYYVGYNPNSAEVIEDNVFDALDKIVKVEGQPTCDTYRKTFNGYAIVNQPDIYTSESEASGSTVLGGLAVVNSETISFKLASELALVPNAPLRSVHYMWPDKLDLSSASGTVSVVVGSQAENLVIVFGCELASKTVMFSINDTDYELATFNESGSVSHNYENIGIVTEYFNNRTTDMQFFHGTGYNLIDQLFQIGVFENQTNLYVKGKDAFKKVVYEDALSLAITEGFKPNYPNGDKNDNPLYGVIAPANEYTYVNVNKASSFSVVLGSIQRPDFVAEYVIEFDITASADISFPSTITWANGVSPTFEKDTKVVVSILNNLAVFAVFPK